MAGIEPEASDLTGLRKTPRQARSRARVEAIYVAAERILATRGVDALTMRDLAEEAGVAMGTVYQFFEDKSAVLDIVVRRHMASFGSVLDEIRLAAAELAWPELVDLIFDRFVERSRMHPAYLAIRAGHHLSSQMQLADDANIAAIASILRAVLVRQQSLADSVRLGRACLVAVQTADALLQLAFRIDPHGDEHTLVEARRIEHLYLNDIVSDTRYQRRRAARPRATAHGKPR